MSDLGRRIKHYEKTFNYLAVKRMPLMVRVDGRAFHSFTKQFDRPFDKGLMEAMVSSAKYVAEDMQGFKVAYIQSDEASFCMTDYDNLGTEGWFNYELPKVISTSAAMMTVAFNKNFPTSLMPTFDSRAFTVPREDVVNAFLWRCKDWERNSLQMYCQSFFSHKQLHRKKRKDMHEMLFRIGKNWTNDLTEQQKNGTFLIKSMEGIIERTDIKPNYVSLDDVFGKMFRVPYSKEIN